VEWNVSRKEFLESINFVGVVFWWNESVFVSSHLFPALRALIHLSFLHLVCSFHPSSPRVASRWGCRCGRKGQSAVTENLSGCHAHFHPFQTIPVAIWYTFADVVVVVLHTHTYTQTNRQTSFIFKKQSTWIYYFCYNLFAYSFGKHGLIF
jgi:hypothetical protein